jgi:hypothetical protein
MSVQDIFTGTKVFAAYIAGDLTEEIRHYSINNDLSELTSSPQLAAVSGQTVASTMHNYLENTEMQSAAIIAAACMFSKGELKFAIDQVDQLIAGLQERKKQLTAVEDDIRSFILTELENNAIGTLSFTYAGNDMSVSIVNPAPSTTIAKEPDDAAVIMYPAFVVKKLVWDKRKIKAALADQQDAFMSFSRDYDCRIESTPTIKITFKGEER